MKARRRSSVVAVVIVAVTSLSGKGSAADDGSAVLLVNAGMSHGEVSWVMEADPATGVVKLTRTVPGAIGRNQLWQMRPHPFPADHPFDGTQIVNVGTGKCLADDGQADHQTLMVLECAFTYVNAWSWQIPDGEPAPGPTMLWSSFTSRTPVPTSRGEVARPIQQLSGSEAATCGDLSRWRTIRSS